MRAQLRKRFVPTYYDRDIQKCFRKLSQGTRTVEDYFEEFEKINSGLEVQDSEETLMAQFLDGLKDRISRKVERQNYVHFEDLLHYAIQAEQHIKRKLSSTARRRTTWNPPPSKDQDKGKGTEGTSRFNKFQPEASKNRKPEQGKSQPQRNREITCYKCQGKGHYGRECPNQRFMLLNDQGEYETEEEAEQEPTGSDEEVINYLEVGEILVTRRGAMFDPETVQRENIFHTRCSIESKLHSLIIDGGSCTNVASKYLVDKLGLKRTKHPHPYKLKWLNDETELKIAEQVIVPSVLASTQTK